jgi:hypothetical protein
MKAYLSKILNLPFKQKLPAAQGYRELFRKNPEVSD